MMAKPHRCPAVSEDNHGILLLAEPISHSKCDQGLYPIAVELTAVLSNTSVCSNVLVAQVCNLRRAGMKKDLAKVVGIDAKRQGLALASSQERGTSPRAAAEQESGGQAPALQPSKIAGDKPPRYSRARLRGTSPRATAEQDSGGQALALHSECVATMRYHQEHC